MPHPPRHRRLPSLLDATLLTCDLPRSIRSAIWRQEPDGTYSIGVIAYRPDRPWFWLNSPAYAFIKLAMAADRSSSVGYNPKGADDDRRFYPYMRVGRVKFPIGRLVAACQPGERYDECPEDWSDLRRECLLKVPAGDSRSKFMSGREHAIAAALRCYDREPARMRVTRATYQATLRECLQLLDELHPLGTLREGSAVAAA